jgi:hypothetical protein
MNKPELRAGMPLDIVFENEINQPNCHYMKAVIYDYDNKLITISQTSPALTRHFLKRRVLATFLARVNTRVLRFGFPAQLIDLINPYTIVSEKTVEALLLKRLAQPEPVDFRLYFRVKPPSETELRLFLEDQKVNLLDISIGGAKFIYPKRYFFLPGDAVKFKLIIGTEIFNIKASVRNVQEPDVNAANKNIQYVSVEFHLDNQKMEVSLGKAILDIERSLLSKGQV